MPTKARTLSVRLDRELEAKVERLARETGRDKSKVLRLLISQARLGSEPDIQVNGEVDDA